MKITSALNFDTPDCHVVGGCDLYTTKAAGPDKKLYKTIEHSLESHYESLLRLSASLSPPQGREAAQILNLARSSPFGPLSEHSSRRTYAYLIATLNASHPDYDFSHLLRPSDFRREKSLRKVMNTIDSTLFNLRPNIPRDVSPPLLSLSIGGTAISKPRVLRESPPTMRTKLDAASMPQPTRGAPTNYTSTATSHSWGPRMWKLIDEQMTLNTCDIYSYNPEEDPYEGDDGEGDGAVWSLKYFFFNRARKRVCYLYLRGISVLSGSYPGPGVTQGMGIPIGAATGSGRRLGYGGFLETGLDTPNCDERERGEESARRKAKCWLGEYAAIKMRRNIDNNDDSDFEEDEEEHERENPSTGVNGSVNGGGKGDAGVDDFDDLEMHMELDGDDGGMERKDEEEEAKEMQKRRLRQLGRDDNGEQRRRSRSPRGSASSGGFSEQMAGMMEV
ncbi:RNA polymerase III-inhibiting protein maf1 [Ascosphaera atra]|nr:RNA polymerase III-inhibiting protein maf1 [Ascosphaera atra]